MNTAQFMERLGDLLGTQIFALGDVRVSVGSLLTAILIVFGAFLLARLAARALRRVLARRGNVDEDSIGAMVRVTHWLVLLPALAVAADLLGVNLTAIFAAGGLFALAIGFAMKSVMENFVSGVILQTERSIRRGDILVTEGGRMIRVRDIGIRATIARGRDDEDLVIPNSQLVQSTVTNLTLNKDRLCRIRTTVGVVYSSDMRLVEETLHRAASEQTWRSPREEPRVLMAEFGSSSVDFEVSVWIEDPWRARRLRGELNRAIWWALQEVGITIAFPQLDVHFDREVAESLAAARAAAG